uniref:Uncharacterized protein n=1 Tax=Arundo donax TaxID=35708 RepID=A0A0A9DV68_ARUDO
MWSPGLISDRSTR